MMSDSEEFAPSSSAPRLNTRSLSQEAYDHIKRLILSGAFREGEKIPEERIAGILKISRTPIREAIRLLGQHGLVTIKPRSYAKVAGVSREEAMQMARVRAELEKMAARELVRSATNKDLSSLGRMARRMVAKFDSGQIAEALMLDGAFHLEMARRGGNAVLYGILERLDARMQLIRARAARNRTPEALGGVLREHQVIIDCLTAPDEENLLRCIEHHIIVSENSLEYAAATH